MLSYLSLTQGWAMAKDKTDMQLCAVAAWHFNLVDWVLHGGEDPIWLHNNVE